MTDIVINTCFGGFGPSAAAQELLAKRKGSEVGVWDMSRDDPDLVAVVRELGKAASDSLAQLEVVTIPDDVRWEIDDYDGNERVAEQHRTWP